MGKDKYIPESLDRERLDSRRPPRPIDIDKIPENPHPKRSTKIANIISVLALLLTALGLGLFLMWSLRSEKVLEVKNSPFPVRSVREHPTADGVIILTVSLCKNDGVTGRVRTSFVSNTREVFLPLSDENLPKGCLDNSEVPVLIPKDMPADTYKVKFRVTYDLNPLKKGVVNEFESQPFVVDPQVVSQ